MYLLPCHGEIGHWSLARFPVKILVFSPACGTSVAYLVWISLAT